MYAAQPDLVILLGTRAALSLVGIVAIAAGQWNWDRAADGEAASPTLSSENTSASAGATKNAGGGGDDADNGPIAPIPCAILVGGGGENARNSSTTSTVAASTVSSATGATSPLSPSDYTASRGSFLPWTWRSSTSAGGHRSSAPDGDASATGSYKLHEGPASNQHQPPHHHYPAPHTLVNLWFDPLRFWTAVTIAGWMLLGLSCLLDPSKWSAVDANGFAVAAMAVALGMAGGSYVYQSGSVDRPHVPPYLCGYAFALVVWGVLAALGNYASHTLNWAPPLGCALVALSMAASWSSRRTGGDSYAQTGRRNPRPVVFHFGGPLLVWGWYWVWVGLSAVPGRPDAWYLPVYLGSRSAVSYVAAAIALGVLFATGYAYDEMRTPSVSAMLPPPIPEVKMVVDPSPPPSLDAVSESLFAGPGFGCFGYFFGAVWEIKLVFTATWLLWGVAAFLPSVDTLWPFFLFLALILNGVAWSVFYEMAIRAVGNPDVARRWAMNGGATLVLLALVLSFDGVVAAALAIPGAMCLFVGQMLLHLDRKRGQHFLLHAGAASSLGVRGSGVGVNPCPRVFSHGSPLTAFGMVLLAWAVSLRP